LEEKNNMDFSEKWGTDVDTAVALALLDLKLSIDEVDVKIIEEPSRGFFGIGSKLALVRVEKKKKIEGKSNKRFENKEKVNSESFVKKPLVEIKPTAEIKPAAEIKPTAEIKPIIEKREIKKPTLEKRIFTERPIGDLSPCENNVALDFLKEVTGQMGLALDISAKSNNENIFIDIQGKDSGTIIGKRGQTLDAIQYLTSLVANKGHENYVRVVVDAESYRAKREKTLEQLAIRLADKVVKTQKSVRLEPMNPYERKVIHATLQSTEAVTTRSEGQDPYRRVIIELK